MDSPVDIAVVPVGEAGTSAYAIVTLNDPDRRNMLSGPMVEAVVAAFDRLEQQESPAIGAVVVTGAGRAFCAGADLGGLARAASAATADGASTVGASTVGASTDGTSTDGTSTDGDSGASLTAIYEGFLRVARCPLPTVAAVNGPAVGAGMNLALACDVRVVAERGRFECRFAELGLHPGGGHTWLLTRLVGPETAAAMVLFSEVLRGEVAVSKGLAWRSVPAGELLEAAGALAAAAAGAPPELLRRIKQSLGRAASTASHADAVAYELEAQVWSISQPFFADRLAGLRARISGAGSTP